MLSCSLGDNDPGFGPLKAGGRAVELCDSLGGEGPDMEVEGGVMECTGRMFTSSTSFTTDLM